MVDIIVVAVAKIKKAAIAEHYPDKGTVESYIFKTLTVKVKRS